MRRPDLRAVPHSPAHESGAQLAPTTLRPALLGLLRRNILVAGLFSHEARQLNRVSVGPFFLRFDQVN